MKNIIYVLVAVLIVINIVFMFIDYKVTFILNLVILCLVVAQVRFSKPRTSSGDKLPE